jgi:hypothetical protein
MADNGAKFIELASCFIGVLTLAPPASAGNRNIRNQVLLLRLAAVS